MKQLLLFLVLSSFSTLYAQCDCEVFSKKMQQYRVHNYELEEQLKHCASTDSSYIKIIQQQRKKITYLRNNQDSLASIPKPLLSHEDEKHYLKKLKKYYIHSGDSTKAAQVNLLIETPKSALKSGN